MRTLAIGDIHGCSAAFEHVLQMAAPSPSDIVVTMGDYVDRGPDSRGVIERLLALRGECRLVPLRGNHEMMMLESRGDARWESNWRGHGGTQTLQSYASGVLPAGLENVPAAHWEFLESQCFDYWETDTHLFVHANLAPDLPLHEQSVSTLLWEFLSESARPHVSGKTMVCGHTALRGGHPLNLGHTICIDTCACGGGFLSCLDIGSGTVYQASQSGMRRVVKLQPCGGAARVMPRARHFPSSNR